MSHLRPIERYEAPKYEVLIAPRAHAQLESLPAEVSDRIEQGLGELAEVADCQMVRMALSRAPGTAGSSMIELNVAEGCVACLRISDSGRTITLVEVQAESRTAYRSFRDC